MTDLSAGDLNWDAVNNFSPNEWPTGVLPWLSGSLVKAVAEVRGELSPGHVMIPSPLTRAHVRHDMSGSRHSTREKTRLSDATDLFMLSWPHAFAAWHAAVRHPKINGIGLYIGAYYGDKQQPMLHLDTRPDPLLWVAYREPDQGWQYVYHVNDPRRFHELLGGVET